MISFTYPLYLPGAIILASVLLALSFQEYLQPWARSRPAIRRLGCGLSRIASPLQPGMLLTIGVLVYTDTFSTLLILRQRAFSTFALDLGIFDQATWLISRGDVPFVTLRGLHIFGDHGSFILLLLAPLYRVLDTPATLFVVESAAIALAAVPLYWLSRERLPGRWLPLLVPFLYLLYPPIEYVNSYEFHPEALAVPLVLFAFYFGLRENIARFALCAGLAALCKEDVALTLVAMGLFFAWRRCVRLGLITSAVALGWFTLEILVILPYYSRVGSFYASLYGSSGSSASGADGSIASAASALQHLAQPINLEYAVLLLLPFGGLPLLGGPVLLIAAPAVLVNLLNVRSNTHTIFFQYTAMVIPWLAVAAIEGLGRLCGHSSSAGRAWLPTTARDRLHFPARLLGAVPQRTLTPFAAAPYVLAAGVLSHFFFSPSPLSFQFLRDESMTSTAYEYRAPLQRYFSTTAHDAPAKEALAMIPPEASVAAQSLYTTHLAHRKQVYQLPLPFSNARQGDSPLSVWGVPGQSPPNVTVDYILFDLKRTMDPMDDGQGLELMLRLRGDRDYRLEMDKDGVMLFRREAASP